MSWYSIGLAAVSGAISALIVSLIFGKNAEKKTAYMIVFCVLFFGLNSLSKQLILPELNAHKARADVELAFADIPAYISIKKHEPALYKSIVDSMVVAKKQGNSLQQMQNIIRSKMSVLIESRMAYASNEALLTYVNVIVLEMDELQRKGEGLCFKFLFPQLSGGFDARKVISQEIRTKDLLALDEVIKTSSVKRSIPSENQVMPYLEPVYISLYSEFGDDVSILENPSDENVDKEMLCRITADLYSRILELPPEQAASSLRWMFSGA